MAIAVQARRQAGQASSDVLQSLVRRRVSELVAVFLALAGLTVLVALVCYDARDPSFDTSTARAAHNLAGAPGALLADLLLQCFGIAGMLPGVTLLAWAWRLGSHRGLVNLPLRLAALLAAMPVTAAVLAALPGPHGSAIPWPSAAGLGGATGLVLKGEVLAAGAELIGPVGPALVWMLAAALAVMLVVLALGLTAGEWRAAGEAMRNAASNAQEVAGLIGRVASQVGIAAQGLIERINGSRAAAEEAEAEVAPEPEPGIRRREPHIAVPPAPAPGVRAEPVAVKPAPGLSPRRSPPPRHDRSRHRSKAAGASRRSACCGRRPPAPPSARPPRRRCRAPPGCSNRCCPITACRAISSKSAPARW